MDLTYDLVALATALDAVERRRWLFDNLPVDPLHREWLRKRAWVRTVHGTTRIEGNTLSDLEVDRLLTASVPRPCRARMRSRSSGRARRWSWWTNWRPGQTWISMER